MSSYGYSPETVGNWILQKLPPDNTLKLKDQIDALICKNNLFTSPIDESFIKLLCGEK